ncbi:hypothetical protein DL93DRAFT_552244 [Clavulina sp. PMI_390]|nr:hypothetical protein DL93DRAFT_552244 [Clavulina sp. PMI_390]
MSASQRLLKAEIDIWFDIFAYAGVVPLIRTRVTCKNFANLTKERSLWVRMLCAFSKEHRIPSATYDISNIHSSPPNTNSDPASGLPVLHDEYDDEVVHPKHTQLIPGGRFLVSVDRSGGRPSITCWDLHRQLENKLNVPMASWSPEDTGGGYWTIVGSPRIQHDRDDPDAFLIMVTSDYWPEYHLVLVPDIFSSCACPFLPLLWHLVTLALSA